MIRFLTARTVSGRSYQNVRLPLHTVFPMDTEAVAITTPSGAHLVTQELPVQAQGGCKLPPAQCHPTGEAFKERPPAKNALGYPQLVPSNNCALCKRWLGPLQSEAKSGSLPTRVDTRERLQCERCHRVRYCDAWCAHIHFEACHKFICPLPPFSTEFNAEYVVRRGGHIRVVPIHCVRQNLINGGGLNVANTALARTHVWSAVPHASKGYACEFCKIPVAPANDDIMHHVWFVSLVTRIRPAKEPIQVTPKIEIDWSTVPRWAAPMVIYNSFPLTDGPPRQTWPYPAEYGRHDWLIDDRQLRLPSQPPT